MGAASRHKPPQSRPSPTVGRCGREGLTARADQDFGRWAMPEKVRRARAGTVSSGAEDRDEIAFIGAGEAAFIRQSIKRRA